MSDGRGVVLHLTKESIMKIELREATVNEKEILNNLMEKYLYEFSQYDGYTFGEDGLFRDPYLDLYFTESDRFAFLIYADGKLAGLALINKYPDCPAPLDWAVAEFFVAYPYRRQGVSSAAMRMLFEKFKGMWHIKYHPKNKGSEVFWKKAAQEAASGNVELYRGDEDYGDGSPAKVLVFKVD